MSLFRKSAGYRYLDAFVLAKVVELATRHFCVTLLNVRNDPGGRTFAQMTHAGRSGSRNFAEGSERLMTSYASAMELLDVARASLCIGEEFAQNGGFRERLATVRSEARSQQDGTPEIAPACPRCGAPMRQRKTRQDNRPFWGCTQYPACRGVLEYKAGKAAS